MKRLLLFRLMLIHPEVTTGISAADRAVTIKMLVDKKTRPEQLGRPGHIFPLKGNGTRSVTSYRTHRGCC